eukprot:Skav216347  [mRNA]  locus=scaffold2385:79614:85467:- [translate_table: standard]
MFSCSQPFNPDLKRHRSQSCHAGADVVPGAFFGALVADAFCLGSHYEYDAKVIKQAYAGTIQRYMGPGEAMGGTTHGVGWGRRNYHPGQKAGRDQTDYGEYNLLGPGHVGAEMCPSVPKRLEALIPYWQQRVTKSWGAWLCTQTKQTLAQAARGDQHFAQAMSLRHAAAYAVFDQEKDIVQAARMMMFTHRNPEALGGGEFFARVAFRIIHSGLKPRQDLQITNCMSWQMGFWIAKFEEATDPAKPLSQEDIMQREFVDDLAMTSMARLWDVGKSEPIKAVGKASPTEGTLPGSIYIILKPPVSQYLLLANAMVGGDNAARAVAIGLVLGAYHGVNAIPQDAGCTVSKPEQLTGRFRQQRDADGKSRL